ncbi:MAG: hypothetical protein PHN98_06875 [Smithellaceae bacterium]|nr:hypothetical protein [Smithellaceae bacterium]
MNSVTHIATFELDADKNKYAPFHREFVFRKRRMSKIAGDSVVTKADKIINTVGAVAVILAGLYFVPLSLFILMG